MDQLYTIMSVLAITSCLGLLYHNIFGSSRKSITLGILRTLFIGTIILILHKYTPQFLLPVIIIVGIIGGYLHPKYRRLLGVLILLMIIAHFGQSISTEHIILIMLGSIIIEEVGKASGISFFSKEVLPYDGIIIGILLGSFFGVFEALWAGRLGNTQEVRMRVSSSLSIHTAVTTTLLGIGVTYKNNLLILTISCIGALSIHVFYNYFQGNIIVIFSLIAFSYILTSYRISRIDRIYIQ